MKFTFLLFIASIFFISGCGSVSANEIVEIVDEGSRDVVEEINFVQIEGEFELPILVLHHIGESPASASADTRVWYVSEEKFEELLKTLQEKNYKTLFMSEVLDFVERGQLPEKSIVLTFDDGASDFYDNAWVLLKKYNMKATVNMMTGVRGENWLNSDEIKELDASGLVEFQSHTRYHAYLTRISKSEAREELQKSKEYLEELLGKPVEVIGYPFGLYNDEIISIARDLGYKAGLTIKSGAIQNTEELFQMKRFIFTNSSNINTLLGIK